MQAERCTRLKYKSHCPDNFDLLYNNITIALNSINEKKQS